MILDYRDVRYRDGGRGEVVGGCRQYDCYGFARYLRAARFGLPWLPAYDGANPRDKRMATREMHAALSGLELCEPRPGALALTWRGRVAVHCGVCVEVDGRLGVIECEQVVNVRWRSLHRFAESYTRVEYYG